MALFSAGRFAETIALAEAMTRRYPEHGFGWLALGTALQQVDRAGDAVLALQQAARLSPNDAQLHTNLGSALQKLGRLPEAEACHRRALQLRPDFPAAFNNLANTLAEAGRFDEAETCHRRAIGLKPDYALAHGNLGRTLQDMGRPADAEDAYRCALRLDPDDALSHYNLGCLLRTSGRPLEAAASIGAALRIDPAYVDAHNELGLVFQDLHRVEEAEASYRAALAIRPQFAEGLSNLGNVLKDRGRTAEAEAAYRRAIELSPGFAEAHSNLGVTLQGLGRLAEAEACYRQALRLKPEFVDAHANLGVTLHDCGRIAEAEQAFRRALALDPDHVEAHSNLGRLLNDQGRLAEAEASYRRALQLRPDHRIAFSNLLFSLNYADHDPAACLAEARRYGRMAGGKVTARFASWRCPPDPARLRVGFVSGDLRQHPVGHFLEAVVAHLDPGRVELFAYATLDQADQLTARLRPRFAAWQPLTGLADEAAARLIHDDGIHVLIDLAGHTAHTRLPVFAWKPAPVQVSWLGYFATTGLPEIDFFLADRHSLPEAEAAHFTEQVWHLPETRLCFTPPDVDLPVAPLPAAANGYVTFGCFNSLVKLNDSVIALWARILATVPDSRLFLKAMQLKDPAVAARLLERFAAHGVPAERLVVEGPVPRAEYLAAYHRVDIALDPFPFTGGTTTAESLWMGVPVLTLAGRRLVSRQGLAMLANLGLDDWIAASPDDYLRLAGRHAADLDRLAALRARLRPLALASPLFDARRFANHFTDALFGMWEQNRAPK